MYTLRGLRFGALALSTMFVLAACEKPGAPTAPSSGGENLQLRFVSAPQVTPVTSVPQSRPYPGTKVQGEASVCKDASSPAGTYTFNVSAAHTHSGDLVATTVSLTPGQCSIVYNRVARAEGVSPFANITITEVIPGGAAYSLNRVLTDEDFVGPRTHSGPSVTFAANSHHGGYADFFNVPLGPPPAGLVNLGTAGPYAILAGSTVTCVTGAIVNGSIGISPGNALTGFGPCVNTGAKDLGNAAAAQAQLDLTAAYNALAALAAMVCPPANVISTDLGGTTKPAGVYCSATSLGVTGTLTLDGGGDPNASFVFQAGSTLTTAGNVVLIGGAQARNVYWLVGSSATIGVGSQWQGNIIALTSITLVDYATLIGRALARNGAVTLGTGNVITLP